VVRRHPGVESETGRDMARVGFKFRKRGRGTKLGNREQAKTNRAKAIFRERIAKEWDTAVG
jgi:hypothetical protein